MPNRTGKDRNLRILQQKQRKAIRRAVQEGRVPQVRVIYPYTELYLSQYGYSLEECYTGGRSNNPREWDNQKKRERYRQSKIQDEERSRLKPREDRYRGQSLSDAIAKRYFAERATTGDSSDER